MKIYVNPPKNQWQKLSLRSKDQQSSQEKPDLDQTVRKIIDQVKLKGDKVLFKFAEEFDQVRLGRIKVTDQEIKNSEKYLDQDLKDAIKYAIKNVTKFHRDQKFKFKATKIESGILCFRKATPIEKVGIYVPAGSAALISSLIMCAVPALIAGCKEIVVCSPAGKNAQIEPAILYTAKILGLNQIFKVGGAQAIAALAYGTESIPKVDKIVGPGNKYVTRAKQFVSLDNVGIDLPAGPTECLIIADKKANPRYIAADIIAQSEHGYDSQVIVVANCANLYKKIKIELNLQLKTIPRNAIVKSALQNCRFIKLNSIAACFNFANVYSSEHLILNIKDASKYINYIKNAGSVFIGSLTAEACGDYASGTNHTLPTAGAARYCSGLSLESFQKIISFQKITMKGLRQLAPTVIRLANAENLVGHARSVEIRLNYMEEKSCLN